MQTLGRLTLVSLLALTLLSGPAVVTATEQNSTSGSNRHRLVDRKLIEALKDRREHRHDRSGSGGGSNGNVAALQGQVTDLQNKVTTMMTTYSSLVTQLQSATNEINLLKGRVITLESNPGGGGSGSTSLTSLAKYVTVDPNPINGVKGPHVIFTGVNLHIRSGSGTTDDGISTGGTPAGLGNLIVGYNEGPTTSGAGRTGSHNIVGGVQNAFTSAGGFVFGRSNWIAGLYATASGGSNNKAEGIASHSLGGFGNDAFFDNSLAP